MSVLTLGTGKTETTAKTIKDIFDEVFGSGRRTIPGISSLPKDRRNKVLMLRRQIDRGTYDIDERIDIVIDDIFMDIKS
jgi:hypothetical protein